jgi:anti-sigma regulatory factor (Ser/Thr protein kinase)
VPRTATQIEILSAIPEWVAIRVPCALEAVDDALAVLEPRMMKLAPAGQDELCTAVREMLMNAIEHGGRNNPDLFVTLTCIQTSDRVLVQIADPGPGFDLKTLKHAAVSNPPDGTNTEHAEIRERAGIRPGGYGIFMARQMVDELIYNEPGNQVLLVKRARE